LHDEKEERRAQRAPLLHANGTWYFHRLAVQIEGHLQVRVGSAPWLIRNLVMFFSRFCVARSACAAEKEKNELKRTRYTMPCWCIHLYSISCTE